MGVYDCLPRGGQVKLWECAMGIKNVGDIVPTFEVEKYVVLLREGGYILVKNGVITKIIENLGRKFYTPEDFRDIPCFDKWGCKVHNTQDLKGRFLNALPGLEDTYYPKEEK